MENKYTFKPYNPQFPMLFLEEKQRLQTVLPKEAFIEHVGSTAILGLGGKGIIDVAIGVGYQKRDLIVFVLQGLGYIFQPRFSTQDRLFFKVNRPDVEEGERTYHVHLMDPNSDQWLDMLFFRDYLKAHSKERERYVALKQKAVLEAKGQGAHYRKDKEPFFQKVLAKRSAIDTSC